MSDRGIKKWAPYKTLETQDFAMRAHKDKEEEIERPTVSSEVAEEINNILINYNNELVEVKYFKNRKINVVRDKIKRIDPYEKKLILFSKKVIMICDILYIEIIDEEESL